MSIVLRFSRIGQSIVVGPASDTPRVPAFARIVVKLKTPQVQRNVVDADSTLHFTAQFQDDEYRPIAPTAVAWRLIDIERCGAIASGSVSRLYPAVDIRIASSAGTASRWDRNETCALVVTASRGAEVLTARTSFRVRRFT